METGLSRNLKWVVIHFLDGLQVERITAHSYEGLVSDLNIQIS